MEADNTSAVTIETGQEISSVDDNKSSEAELLSDGQNELQGAVIIYDNESQEGQVVKLITNIKAEDNGSSQNPDPDNVITLHASSNDSKDETIEENLVHVPTQETVKSEAPAVTGEAEPEEPAETADAADGDSDDDETIATFITSTGQQLALYAVEDSDEVFAVALYDESGEPPTNFHFLMKSDVERLIGEGAVKTVKKPVNKGQTTPSQKKDEEIKFERVTQVPVQQVSTSQVSTPQISTPQISMPQVSMPQVPKPQVPTPQAKEVDKVEKTEEVKKVEKKEDILAKSLAGIKTELSDLPDSPEKVQEVKVQKKESPAKIITKNHNVNNKTVSPPVKKIVNQTRPVVAQTKQVVKQIVAQPKQIITQVKQRVFTQTRPIATQAKTIIGQTRPVVAQTKQIITQSGHIVTQRQLVAQPRHFVTQQRKIITQPRQIVAQRQIIAQPRQIVTQARQLVVPTRQYINPTRQYGNQAKTIIYQAKPPTQPIRTAVTPIKKPVVNQKEKITYVLQNQDESFVLDVDSDAEILEQSTVQYILCDDNPSDSELTFDELQASIQSFKNSKPPPPQPLPPPVVAKVEVPKPKKEMVMKFTPTIRSTPKSATILTPKKPMTQVYRTYKSPKKARTTNNLLQAHRKIKQEVIDPAYGDFDDGHTSDDLSQSRQNSTLDSSSGVKAKRSRKQQLTVVNRGDSEIIIQPASAYSEEEDEPIVQKRRGRRKKKVTIDPDYNPRQPTKKGRRSTRHVEIIDIDVDEAERSNVMEITLDGKKTSSDKENDVISVGDTDEEDDDDDDDEGGPRKKKIRKPMMQCTHCMRNFRKRRALERHVQICPKSPAFLEKLEEKKKLGIDKKFKCKSCDEYFDIAVALARHVRVVHSPRKRGRPPKGWVREDISETEETDVTMDESSPEREVGPAKRRGRLPRKESVSKEKDKDSKSPAPEGESKSETVADSQPQAKSSTSSEPKEPKRRGRPPGKKRSFFVKKSVTPELEDKVASSDEKKVDLSTRKRGRPPKRSISQEEESEDVEEKAEEASESSTLPKKRGRPKKKSMSKDEETDTAEGDEKIESSAETPSAEPKTRGRRSKRTMSKDEEPTDDAKSTASEDKAENESSKKQKLNEEEGEAESVKEEAEKKSDEPRRRGRPPKDKLASTKDEKIVESSEAETETEEPRKRGRSGKSIDLEPAKKIKTEVDEMEEVVLSASQTGKLKKLHCAECGKWFSSVAALNTHQLQHRTKKSAIVVRRCQECNNLVPNNSFATHMSTQHNKPLASTSTAKPDESTATTTNQVQLPDKTVKVVQRSLRSSN